MRLIEKNKLQTTVRNLSLEEADAVRRFCGAGKETEACDASVLASILGEMRDNRDVNYWLVCDCRGTEVKGSLEPDSEKPKAPARETSVWGHLAILNKRFQTHTCACNNE